jgi:hypothetical protein
VKSLGLFLSLLLISFHLMAKDGDGGSGGTGGSNPDPGTTAPIPMGNITVPTESWRSQSARPIALPDIETEVFGRELNSCPINERTELMDNLWDHTLQTLNQLEASECPHITQTVDNLQQLLGNNNIDLSAASCENFQVYYEVQSQQAIAHASRALPLSDLPSSSDNYSAASMLNRCEYDPENVEMDSLTICLEDQQLEAQATIEDRCAATEAGRMAMARNSFTNNAVAEIDIGFRNLVNAAQNCQGTDVRQNLFQLGSNLLNTAGFAFLTGPSQIAAAAIGNFTNILLNYIAEELNEAHSVSMIQTDNYTEKACFYLSLERIRCAAMATPADEIEEGCDCGMGVLVSEQEDIADLSDIEQLTASLVQQFQDNSLAGPSSRFQNGNYNEFANVIAENLSTSMNHTDHPDQTFMDYLNQLYRGLLSDETNLPLANRLREYVQSLVFFRDNRGNLEPDLFSDSSSTPSAEQIAGHFSTIFRHGPSILEQAIRAQLAQQSERAEVLAQWDQAQLAFRLNLDTLRGIQAGYQHGAWSELSARFLDTARDGGDESLQTQFAEIYGPKMRSFLDAHKGTDNPPINEHNFNHIVDVLKACALSGSMMMRPGSGGSAGDSYARSPRDACRVGGNSAAIFTQERASCHRYHNFCQQFQNCDSDNAGHTGFPDTESIINARNIQALDQYQCHQIRNFSQQVQDFRDEYFNRGTICGKPVNGDSTGGLLGERLSAEM